MMRPTGISWPGSSRRTAGCPGRPSYGEAPGLLMLLLIASRWQRNDTQRSRARDRQIDRDGGADAELEEYNAYLARLNGSGPSGAPPAQL
nr:hypothetical protein [Tetrasphaera australiensis]